MKPLSLREKALNYRRGGCSYNMIYKKLGLAKSTLSGWLREIPYKPNKEARKRIKLNEIRIAEFKNKQKISNIEEMKK